MNRPVLTLYVSKWMKFDLYPHELLLTEGISCISRGAVTVYSKGSIPMEELKQLLSATATVRISQKNSLQQDESRYFSGIVTSVRHCGAVSQQFEGTVCKYELIIESPLAVLRCSSPRRYYIEKNAEEVIGDILEDHGLKAVFSAKAAETAQIVHPFTQGGADDYEFLLRILAECGLNYIFRSSRSPLTAPQMHIFAADPVSVSELEGCAEEKITDFHCGSLDDEKNRVMMSWEMSSSFGLDKVEINYEDIAGIRQQSAFSDNGSGARKKTFNTFPFGTKKSEDGSHKAELLLSYFESSKNIWKGRASSICAMPGSAIALSGFGGGSSSIRALVTSSRLFARGAWPGELLTDSDADPEMEIEINACDLSAVQEHIAAPESNMVAAVHSMLLGAKGPAGTAELITGTVCNANGETEPQNTCAPLILRDGRETYSFFVLTENAQQILVQLTMPLGGFKQGLFRVPRLGDRVLLQGDTSGSHYLHSYLPNAADMPFSGSVADDIKGYDTAAMTVLRHSSPGKAGAEMGLIGGREADDEPDTPLTPDDLNPEFYYKENDNILVKKSKTAEPEYSESFAGGPHLSSEFTLGAGPRGEDAHIISDGDTLLSANDSVNIKGKNITLSTPGWVESSDNDWGDEHGVIDFSNINSFLVEAKDHITLRVGHNVIELNRNGVVIRSGDWSDSPGLTTSSIVLDSFSGTTIRGQSCSLDGTFGTTFAETSGGGISCSSGKTSIFGADILARTNVKKYMAGQFSRVAAMAASTLIGIVWKNDEGKALLGSSIATSLGNAAALGLDLAYNRQIFQTQNSHPGNKMVDVVLVVGSIINSVIETIVELLDTVCAKSSWYNDPQVGEFSGRDLIRLLGAAAQITVWGLTFFPVLAMLKGKGAKIELSEEYLERSARVENSLQKENTKSNSVAAGKDVQQDQDQNQVQQAQSQLQSQIQPQPSQPSSPQIQPQPSQPSSPQIQPQSAPDLSSVGSIPKL